MSVLRPRGTHLARAAVATISGDGVLSGFRRCVTCSPALVDNMPKVVDAVFGEDDDRFAQFGFGIVVVGAKATVFREHRDRAIAQKCLRPLRASQPHILGCKERSCDIPSDGLKIRFTCELNNEGPHQAAAATVKELQFQLRKSSSRVIGVSAMRENIGLPVLGNDVVELCEVVIGVAKKAAPLAAHGVGRVNRARNSSSECLRPSSVNTKDFTLLTGSAISPFR